jgi:hypothetical protein
MKEQKQMSLGEPGFLPKKGKESRREVFLSELEQLVPWSRLEGLIDP